MKKLPTSHTLSLTLVFLLLIFPLITEASPGMGAGAAAAMAAVYFLGFFVVAHIPFVLLSFFYAVNAQNYSDRKRFWTLIILSILAIANCFLFGFSILTLLDDEGFGAFYGWPAVGFLTPPLLFMLIGILKANKKFITKGIMALYIINFIAFFIGGFDNQEGWGPKHGTYVDFDDYGQPTHVSAYSFGDLTFSESAYEKSPESFDEYINHPSEGSWVLYHHKGNVAQKGFFKNNKREGLWENFYANGLPSLSINYKDGKKSGDFEKYDSEGSLEEKGIYKNNLKDGEWKKYNGEEENTTINNYKNGVKEGFSKENLDYSSRLEEGRYINGKREGEWKTFHDNKNLNTLITYLNGIKEGPSKSYFTGGELAYEALYKKDKEEGQSKRYYENGQVRSQGFYIAGTRNGKWREYHKNGQLKHIVTYPTGPSKWYDEEGNLTSEGLIKDFLKTGTWKEFYANGQVKTEGEYDSFNKTGIWKNYAEDGSLLKDTDHTIQY